MPGALDDDRQARLAGYLDAFERYDTTRLASLLHQEAHRHPPLLNHPGGSQGRRRQPGSRVDAPQVDQPPAAEPVSEHQGRHVVASVELIMAALS
jgi:hypothetical protein